MIPAFIIKFLLGRWVTTAEGDVKAGAQWLFATPVHILIVVCALLGAHDARVTYLLGHRDAALAKVPAQLSARDAAWSGPFDLMRDATLSLIATVGRQNAAVLSLAKDSASRIAGQQAALSAATARAQASAPHASAIEAEAAQRLAGPRCATGPAIMAAKGVL